MDARERFEDFTKRLVAAAAQDDDVEGLVLLGSTADVERVDEWSDHDFYLVVREGEQERFRTNLGWLPDSDDIAIAVRETEHGLKVVYRGGGVLEFAVASGPEVSTFGGSPYAVVLDRADVAARMNLAPTEPHRQVIDSLREFRLFLSILLIGVGRARRGEELAGGRLVRTDATEHLLQVLRHEVASSVESAAVPDPFNTFRRFEAGLPDIGRRLGEALALPVSQCGARLLEIAEENLRPVWAAYPGDELEVVRGRLGYHAMEDT